MPYPQSWTVYTSGASFVAGLVFTSTYVWDGAGGTGGFVSTVAPALANSASLVLFASATAGNLVHSGPGAGHATQASLRTRIRVDSIRNLGTNTAEVGLFFLQTASDLTCNPVSCYGLVWRPPSGVFAVMKYNTRLAAPLGAGSNTLLASSTFALSVGVDAAIRVSWVASAGGTQIIAYGQTGSSFSFVLGNLLASVFDTTVPITAASAVAEGLGLRELLGGIAVTFDSTALSA